MLVGAQVVPARSFVESGPIFLDQLRCSDQDSNLLECNRDIADIGLTLCDHTTDVWVQCTGMYIYANIGVLTLVNELIGCLFRC